MRAGCEGKAGASGSYNEARIYDRYRTIVADALGSRVPSRLQSVSQCLFLLPDLVVLILRLLKDKRVPAKAKINLGIAFAYLTSPVDILPDLVPVLGQLDDLIIATTAIHSILRSTPESVIRENWSGSVDVLEGVQNILDAVSYIAGNKLIMRLITGFVGKTWFVVAGREETHKQSDKRQARDTKGPGPWESRKGAYRMIVVTGATGHLGNNLVRALVRRNHRVRCLVLPGESLVPLGGLDVEIVEGDVRDIECLYQAFDGADTVFHLASIISLLPGRTKLLEEVNVKGAKNVAQACLKTGVRRLVYTSSIHALVEPPIGQVIDETMPCDPDRISVEYSKSKARATLEVMDVISQGLDGVIVMPTGVIGPYDFKPSATGQMLLDYASGKIPVRIEGGYDFVDVRDVAEGHILVS